MCEVNRREFEATRKRMSVEPAFGRTAIEAGCAPVGRSTVAWTDGSWQHPLHVEADLTESGGRTTSHDRYASRR